MHPFIENSFLDPATKVGAIILGIIAGVIVIGLQRIIRWLQLLVSNLMIFKLASVYTLDGYWVSIEWKDGEIVVANFNKVIQRKQKVKFHMWQYSIDDSKRQYKPYYSEGIMKGNHLSAYFYSGDKNVPETGALTFKLEGQRLVGKYIQFSVDLDVAELIESPSEYCLFRINLPYPSKVKMLFGKAPFKTKEEALQYASSNITLSHRRRNMEIQNAS